MYFLTGINEQLRSITELSSIYNLDKKITSFDELKNQFRTYLQFEQPSKFINSINSDSFSSIYLLDEEYISEYIAQFKSKCILTDLNVHVENTTSHSMIAAYASIKEALNYIEKNIPDLFQLFKLVIQGVFYHRSKDSGGGSISSAIGIIWLSHRKNWTTCDILEFLIHELTHSLLFIDERRYCHYRNISSITEESNYAISAILKKLRPLDKVFHSLVVANEILSFREKFGESGNSYYAHPQTKELIENCKVTLNSIKTISNLEMIAERRWLDLLQRVELSIDSFRG